MKDALSWLDNNFEKYFIGALLVGITLLSTLQVVMRYCFLNALPWVEETVVYMHVWIGFIGCSYAMQQDIALRIDLGGLIPAGPAAVIKFVADAVSVGFYLFICFVGVGVVRDVIARGQTSPAAEIPLYVLHSALLIGAGLACLRWVQRVYRLIVHRKPW